MPARSARTRPVTAAIVSGMGVIIAIKTATTSDSPPPPPSDPFGSPAEGSRSTSQGPPRLRLGPDRYSGGGGWPVVAAGPPAPAHRQTRLLPLLRPGAADHPGPGRRQPVGGRGGLPDRQGTDRAGPAPGSRWTSWTAGPPSPCSPTPSSPSPPPSNTIRRSAAPSTPDSGPAAALVDPATTSP